METNAHIYLYLQANSLTNIAQNPGALLLIYQGNLLYCTWASIFLFFGKLERVVPYEQIIFGMH